MKMNRRKLLSILSAGPAVLASTAAAKDQNKKPLAAPAEAKIEALNPRGMPPAIQLIPMAPRPASLDGKTIYLISDGFPGADLFLNQVATWLKKNMPNVGTEYRLKKGGFPDDDPQLWAEIKAKGRAAIMAIGH